MRMTGQWPSNASDECLLDGGTASQMDAQSVGEAGVLLELLEMGWSFLQRGRTWLLPLLLLPMLATADIYVSRSDVVVPKWSTQALDASYAKTSIVEMAPLGEIRGLVSNPAPRPTKRYQPNQAALHGLIVTTSARYAVPSELVEALITVESGFNTHAVSPKGARGLMQLMPATARRYGMKNEQELHVPALNLDMGVRHLKDLLTLHQGQMALTIASYNAGQYAVAKHGQRIPRYHETMLYVPAVLAQMARNSGLTEDLKNQ
jgi:soluble lytic murein transglycosylase-like protein